MILRSMLFVPADSEKKLAKADGTGADAVILDLEDSVSAPRKEAARGLIGEFLRARPQAARKARIFMRINPLGTDAPLHDLAAIGPDLPDGIVLPKCSGPEDVAWLSARLDDLENRTGAVKGTTKIVAIAGETARGVLALNAYAASRPNLSRLIGLTWGPWDLAADLGAASNQDIDGNFSFTYRMAMSMTLLAAKAAGVQAIDTVYADLKDDARLLAWCKFVRREGWNGKLAIHPAQVPIIHEGFRPSADEVAAAERVILAFANTAVGVVALDGAMLDLPHLIQARYILALRDAG